MTKPKQEIDETGFLPICSIDEYKASSVTTHQSSVTNTNEPIVFPDKSYKVNVIKRPKSK